MDYKEYRFRLLFQVRREIAKVKKTKARKAHTCWGCGRTIQKGEEFWGRYSRNTVHKCGPGSKKGHSAWEFINVHICNACYEAVQKIKPDMGAPFVDVCWRCADLLEKSKLWGAVENHSTYPPVCPHFGEPELGWDYSGKCQVCGRTSRLSRYCLIRELMPEAEFNQEIERLKMMVKGAEER